MDHHINHLVTRIVEHCERLNIAETTFGARAVNDGKLVSRLRNGGTVTLKTLAMIEDELSNNKKGAA